MRTHSTVLVVAEGASGITDSIGNLSTMLKVIGGALLVLMMIVIAIMIAVASAKEGGWRSSIQKLLGVLAAGLVLGGGPLFIGYMVEAGESVPGNGGGGAGNSQVE
ncbi:hypothetical protein G9U53_31825 [Rhodococcus sp. D-46]|nr:MULTISPECIES: hypothetical protein [Rhodococcus]KZF15161.1 hypothetical protein A2J01_32090 [Rhodococcus sp. EPR-134]MDJ0440234.1 hypothetical protein [Rhodococcus qingshengii]NHE68903.1 hypothetical protein [Rhodococcus sp. D-46]